MRAFLVPSVLTIASSLTAAESVLDPQADQLPLITVTSTKVPTDPVTVPAAVAVVTGVQAIESGYTSIDDVAGATAGVHYMSLGSHTTYPVIRGMFSLEVDPPTGYYVDGVPQRGLGADQLVDIDRVEILRGPQGTLYGRNSVPGIVNVITRDPGASWSGYGILDGAQRHLLGATVAAGGPVTDTVGLRLAARGARQDSSVSNNAPTTDRRIDREERTLQGKLRWHGHDDLTTVTFAGVSNRFRNDGDHFAPVADALRHETANNHLGQFSNQMDNGSLTVSQALASDITFTSVTGGNRYADIFDIDLDYTPANIMDLSQEVAGYVFTQEFRVVGGTGLHSWVIGLYGMDDRRHTLQDLSVFPTSTTNHLDGQLHTRNMALFGQAGIPLGERLTVTLGIRGDYERQTVHHDAQSVNYVPGSTYAYTGDQAFHALLPKASVSWSWSPSSFTYASLSRGYKSGGYNHTPTVESDIAGGYDPEYATVTEVGHRAELFDRRLSVNVAAYHTDYTNKQMVILESPRFYYVNAARAEIDGGEIEIKARAAPGLDVFASLGVIRSRITHYDGPTSGTLPDLQGKRLSMAPSYDGDLGFQYRHPSGAFLRSELQGIGSYAADNDNNIMQDPYRLLAVKIGYEWNQAAVYLWGRNLNDARYLTRGSTTALKGTPQEFVGVAGEPRTLGATAQIEF